MKTKQPARPGSNIASTGEKTKSTTSSVLASTEASEAHVEPQWAWHYLVLLRLRERLRAELGEQRSQAAQPLEPHSMDMADSATDEFDHNLALTHLSAEQDALYEVEGALRRIRDGTYGVCEETGKPIPAARLRAIPWARFSRGIELRREQAGATGREHLGKPESVHASIGEGFDQAETEGVQKEEPAAEDETMSDLSLPSSERKHATKPARSRARTRASR